VRVCSQLRSASPPAPGAPLVLPQDLVAEVAALTPNLIRGLAADANRIDPEERSALVRLSQSRRIVFLVYIDKYANVRWFKDERMIGKTLDEFVKEYPEPTDASYQAFLSRRPTLRRIREQPLQELAIPLIAPDSSVAGMLDLHLAEAQPGQSR